MKQQRWLARTGRTGRTTCFTEVDVKVRNSLCNPMMRCVMCQMCILLT